MEQTEEETSDSEYLPEEDEDYEFDDDAEYDEYMDELMAGEDEEGMAMMPMMGPGGDNMKFNIIFTVGKPGEMYGEEDDDEEEASEAEYNSEEEDGPEIEEVEEDEEEDEEEEEEEEEKTSKRKTSKDVVNEFEN